MPLNESIVEDPGLATLKAAPIPVFSQREKEKREAIRRLNPAIPEEAPATHKESLSVQIERRLNP